MIEKKPRIWRKWNKRAKLRGFDYTEMFNYLSIPSYPKKHFKIAEEKCFKIFEEELEDALQINNKAKLHKMAKMVRKYLKAIKEESRCVHFDHCIYAGLLVCENDETLLWWALRTYKSWWT